MSTKEGPRHESGIPVRTDSTARGVTHPGDDTLALGEATR